MTNPVSGAQTAGAPSLSIVLVHGAFVDGSGWQQVYGELVDRGFDVLVAQHPTISLEGDVAAVNRLIDTASHLVLLVGHSYGGAVITEAGANPKVQALATSRGKLGTCAPPTLELSAAVNSPSCCVTFRERRRQANKSCRSEKDADRSNVSTTSSLRFPGGNTDMSRLRS